MALVAPGRTRTIDVSTPCAAKSARIVRPSGSSPTVPANAARIPSAAAPAAALAAGPPPKTACESMRTFVSCGMNGSTAMWSLLQKPSARNSVSCMGRIIPHPPPGRQAERAFP